MHKFRMRFEKTGRAVYISHLDLMHTFQRAFSRAGLELEYSNGFNPHPVISIAMPLSIGTSSICEIMDFSLKNSENPVEIAKLLNHVLPDGIKVLKVYAPERKITELKWLEAEGVFKYDAPVSAGDLRSFFCRKEILIMKKTKRGEGAVDITKSIRSLDILENTENEMVIHVTVSAFEPVFNPDLLVAALSQNEPALTPDYFEFRRIQVYDKDMTRFE